jgi:DNA mismatch endonuclease, patch repair protein
MPDVTNYSTSAGRSRNMRAIRRVDTKPEIELRSALHRAGRRFRKDLLLRIGSSRVRPDIVFTARKVAVFVDGCFWHCCPEHGRQPTANVEYWAPKLQKNVERDRRVDFILRQDGWTVVRVWEHQSIGEATRMVTDALAEFKAN